MVLILHQPKSDESSRGCFLGTKGKEERINFIPDEAIEQSNEARNPKPGTLAKKNKDSFSEDKMSRDIPADESVRTSRPDDTVQPG